MANSLLSNINNPNNQCYSNILKNIEKNNVKKIKDELESSNSKGVCDSEWVLVLEDNCIGFKQIGIVKRGDEVLTRNSFLKVINVSNENVNEYVTSLKTNLSCKNTKFLDNTYVTVFNSGVIMEKKVSDITVKDYLVSFVPDKVIESDISPLSAFFIGCLVVGHIGTRLEVDRYNKKFNDKLKEFGYVYDIPIKNDKYIFTNSSPLISSSFKHFFSKKNALHENILFTSEINSKEFIEGIFAVSGKTRGNGKKSIQIPLLYSNDIILVLQRLKNNYDIKYHDDRFAKIDLNVKNTEEIFYRDDNIFTKIKQVRKNIYKGMVYDIVTEKYEYRVNGILARSKFNQKIY